MLTPIAYATASPAEPSLLTLSDRLISLARDADRAGFSVTAEQLVRLALNVFDEAPRRTQ